MAMRKCPDCGKLVSALAESCPDCGRPLRIGRKGNAFNPFHDPVHFIGLLIVLAIAIPMVVMGVKLLLEIIRSF